MGVAATNVLSFSVLGSKIVYGGSTVACSKNARGSLAFRTRLNKLHTKAKQTVGFREIVSELSPTL
jgi:hypothetical protein